MNPVFYIYTKYFIVPQKDFAPVNDANFKLIEYMFG